MSAPRPRTGRAIATVLLTLAGLFAIGRFALDAWMWKPMPGRLAVPARPGAIPRPVGASPGPAVAPPPPLFVAIVDGLRAEAVEPGPDPAMPVWLALAKEGASGIALTGEPTLTACCVRTILTGRNPDLYTAFRNFDAAAAAGSLTQFLVERGLRAAHAGDAAAWQMTRAYYLEADVLAFPDRGPADQGGTDDQSFPFALAKARDPGVGLLTFHVVRPDHAGHKHGATGSEYRAACGIVDEQLRVLVEAFRGTRPGAYVLLTADHGVTPRGTHGGGEPGARRAPFVLLGPRVARVANAVIAQSSLAPTLAVLLGLPVPPLAETGPAVELTTLTPGERAAALDAYLAVRLDVARDLGARDVAEAIDARRRQVFRDGPAAAIERLAGEYRTLDREAFASVGTHAAALALLLSALWMVALVLGVDDERPGGVALAGLAATIALAAALAAPDAWVAVALIAACLAYARPSRHAQAPGGAHAAGRRGTGALVLAAFVAFPVLGAAGLLLQDAFDATESSYASALRTASVVGGLALLGSGLLLRRDVRRRVLDVFARHPALVPALGGVALGFTLSLRLFIDPFVHTPILFAAGGVVATAWISRRGARRDRAILLAVAGVLFVAGRGMEGLYPDWILSPRAAGLGWLLAIGAGTALLLSHVRETARADRPAVALAVLSLAAACVLRLALPGTRLPWHAAMGAGLAALTVTAFQGTPDGRLWVRLVAVVALGSVLHDRSDAQWLALVLLALGALAGARLPAPTGRVRVAALAVAVLAIRIALFHAMGFTESFSTLDTGAGAVPGAGQAAAEARGQVGLTSEVVVNALLMALKYGLVWIALLAAVVRSLERDGRAHLLPTIAADLSITYAARAAALVAGVWVWWRSSWWASTAYPVFAIALIDVVLLAAGALWVRTPRSPRAAEAPADVATAAA